MAVFFLVSFTVSHMKQTKIYYMKLLAVVEQVTDFHTFISSVLLRLCRTQNVPKCNILKYKYKTS